MASTLTVNYRIDVTGANDEFAPDQIVGERTESNRRLLRNHTWLWSRVNLRRGQDWACVVTPIPILDVAWATTWGALANLSTSRTRLEFQTDALNAELRLTVADRAFVPIAGPVINTHGGIRSVQTSIITAIPATAVFLLVEDQQNGTPSSLFSCRLRELHILAAAL